MCILVFRTSLSDRKDIQLIGSTLNNHPQVMQWNVDLDDWEKILRIEVKDIASENGIAECIRTLGFECEDLDH